MSSSNVEGNRRIGELPLGEFFRILIRNKYLVVGIVGATLALSMVATAVQARRYTSSVEIFLQLESASDAVVGNTAGRLDRDRALANEVGFIESSVVFAAATTALGHEPTIKVRAADDRDFIVLTATAGSPTAAANDADIYVKTYIDLRRTMALESLSETSSVVQAQVDALTDQIETLDADLTKALAAGRRTGSPTSQEIERDFAERREPLASQRLQFTQYLTTAQLNADLTSGASGQVVSTADIPTSPSSPKPIRNAMAALVIGLAVATAAAMGRHAMNDVISDSDVQAGSLAGLPVLATVPHRSRRSRSKLPALELDGPEAEAYRTLRTALAFAAIADDRRVFQITSGEAADGKSTTAANLAIAMAQAGERVVLIDADLRRPTLGSVFDLPDDGSGLSNLLARQATTDQALVPVGWCPNLTVLPSGPVLNDAAAALSSKEFSATVAELRSKFDIVLIDSPPVNAVSDPLMVAKQVDGVVVVVRHQKTKRATFATTLNALGNIDADVLGIVRTGLSRRAAIGSGGYDHYYPASSGSQHV